MSKVCAHSNAKVRHANIRDRRCSFFFFDDIDAPHSFSTSLGEARPVRAEVNKDDPLITQPVFVLFIKQAVQPFHQNRQGDGLFFTFPPSAFHHVALRTRRKTLESDDSTRAEYE